MEDYVYNPPVTGEQNASTSLAELDEIEAMKRHADKFSEIPRPDNKYPNILEDPLYVKTVPDQGILASEYTANQRTRQATKAANELRKKKDKTLVDMSIKEFISSIANSLLDIINDLLEYKRDDSFISIFTKENRLLSIGVLLVILSVFLIFFRKLE